MPIIQIQKPRASSKVLLLDMDGVVLHQPHLHRFVAMRVVSYVRRKLDPVIQGITYDQAEHINKTLYSTYGHTLLGLNRMFQVETDVSDFNKSVYDKITLDYIQNFQDDYHMNKRANEVRQLLERTNRMNIPVYIFSNAPVSWCEIIMNTMGLPIFCENILGSDHPLFDKTGQLKPIASVYTEVEGLITHRHGKDGKRIFVDDSMVNLRPCIGMSTWNPILLNPNLPDVDATGFSKISIRSSIRGIEDFI